MNDEEQLRAQLDAVYRSTSWRVTAPLRALALLWGRVRQWGHARPLPASGQPRALPRSAQVLSREAHAQLIALETQLARGTRAAAHVDDRAQES